MCESARRRRLPLAHVARKAPISATRKGQEAQLRLGRVCACWLGVLPVHCARPLGVRAEISDLALRPCFTAAGLLGGRSPQVAIWSKSSAHSTYSAGPASLGAVFSLSPSAAMAARLRVEALTTRLPGGASLRLAPALASFRQRSARAWPERLAQPRDVGAVTLVGAQNPLIAAPCVFLAHLAWRLPRRFRPPK